MARRAEPVHIERLVVVLVRGVDVFFRTTTFAGSGHELPVADRIVDGVVRLPLLGIGGGPLIPIWLVKMLPCFARRHSVRQVGAQAIVSAIVFKASYANRSDTRSAAFLALSFMRSSHSLRRSIEFGERFMGPALTALSHAKYPLSINGLKCNIVVEIGGVGVVEIGVGTERLRMLAPQCLKHCIAELVPDLPIAEADMLVV